MHFKAANLTICVFAVLGGFGITAAVADADLSDDLSPVVSVCRHT